MVRLALVMIARNEAERIGRALRSVAPYVDKMIVMDTGSTDGTAALAAQCGAEVHHFTWCDDFSAARNASLSKSDAEWNLVLDADEWLQGSPKALGPATLVGTSGARRFVGEIQRTNQIAQGDSAGVSTTWIPRILPRGTLYAGRVHEQPQSNLPGRRLAVKIGHDGFLPDGLARKAGRNEQLLLRELEDTPDDPYLWFQLGKEHQAREKPAEAAACLERAYTLCPAGVPYRHGLVVRAISAFKAADRLEKARALVDAESANWADSPDFWFVVGDLYLEWSCRNPDQAIGQGLPVCEQAWKRCLEIGERPDLDGAVKGRGSYMAAHNLALMYETFGPADRAAKYRSMAKKPK